MSQGDEDESIFFSILFFSFCFLFFGLVVGEAFGAGNGIGKVVVEIIHLFAIWRGKSLIAFVFCLALGGYSFVS